MQISDSAVNAVINSISAVQSAQSRHENNNTAEVEKPAANLSNGKTDSISISEEAREKASHIVDADDL